MNLDTMLKIFILFNIINIKKNIQLFEVLLILFHIKVLHSCNFMILYYIHILYVLIILKFLYDMNS